MDHIIADSDYAFERLCKAFVFSFVGAAAFGGGSGDFSRGNR